MQTPPHGLFCDNHTSQILRWYKAHPVSALRAYVSSLRDGSLVVHSSQTRPDPKLFLRMTVGQTPGALGFLFWRRMDAEKEHVETFVEVFRPGDMVRTQSPDRPTQEAVW